MKEREALKSVAIVPAAGTGARMGRSLKKQFLLLDGQPILTRTIGVLESCPEIDAVILVVPEEERDFCENRIVADNGFAKVVAVVTGGTERQDSVYKGLQCLDHDTGVVLVHDGVRPFLTATMVRETTAAAASGMSAVVGVPIADTVKSVGPGGLVMNTLSRNKLWSIQTPQAFPLATLMEAYERALGDGYRGTDDASLVERLGRPVRVLMGSRYNIKITTPEDLVIGEAILGQRERERC